jgi:hypothetical protein
MGIPSNSRKESFIPTVTVMNFFGSATLTLSYMEL